MSSDTSSTGNGSTFSLREARNIVRDLFEPNEKIYWTDFLLSIFGGYVSSALVRLIGEWMPAREQLPLSLALRGLAFAVSCCLLFRSVLFIHEIVHLPEKKFRAFRFVWNLLCGIPFLTPSFTYYPHLDHHRRRTFGTHEDGEYLPLARMTPWVTCVYLFQGLIGPPLAVLRFGILSPIAWISPKFRTIVHRHFSTLVMDPTFIRPLPTKEAMRLILLQEICCFLVCVGVAVIPPVFLGRWPIQLVVQGYATGLVLITLNAVRTLAAHRWWSEGNEVSFVEQMEDSVVIDNDSLASVLINPVGLRYHALHHLFPSMPYHNLRAAHKRLMAELPANSSYRATVETSVLGTIGQLLVHASQRKTSGEAQLEQAEGPTILAFPRTAQEPQSGSRHAA